MLMMSVMVRMSWPQTPKEQDESQLLSALQLKCNGGTRRTDVTVRWARVLLAVLFSSPYSRDLVQHSVMPPPVTVQSKIPPKLSHTQSNCSANANQVSINSLELHQCGPCLYSSGSVKHLNEHLVLSARLIDADLPLQVLCFIRAKELDITFSRKD